MDLSFEDIRLLQLLCCFPGILSVFQYYKSENNTTIKNNLFRSGSDYGQALVLDVFTNVILIKNLTFLKRSVYTTLYNFESVL